MNDKWLWKELSEKLTELEDALLEKRRTCSLWELRTVNQDLRWCRRIKKEAQKRGQSIAKWYESALKVSLMKRNQE